VNYIPPGSALAQQCGAAVNNGDTATQLREIIGGNPNLQPETATIFTVGLVLEPRMLEGFTLTLDYYDVHVKNTVSLLNIGTILNGCYPGDTGPVNAQMCGLITRNSLNFIDTVIDTNQNIGQLLTAGLDISARYALNTGSIGRFNFGFDGTVLLKDDWVRPDGTTVHAKGTYDFQYADPNFKGRASVLWNMKSLSAGLSARYIGGFKECGDVDGFSDTANLCRDTPQFSHNVASMTTFDATVGYTLASSQGKTNIALGVNNLADTAPPANYNAFQNQADTVYDYMGRFFYARVSHSF
jgi:outer membrane receptor protein involved in Fe transport